MRDLGSKEVQALSDAELKTIITGRQRQDEAGQKLAGADVDNVVAYMRTFKNNLLPKGWLNETLAFCFSGDIEYRVLALLIAVALVAGAAGKSSSNGMRRRRSPTPERSVSSGPG